MPPPCNRPSNAVNSCTPVSGSAYGASVPDTHPSATRTKLIVSTAERGAAAPAGVAALFQAWSGRPKPRGIMMTSPNAESPLAVRVNEMLPLRPVAALEYAPSQWPARVAMSPGAPTRGTGVCGAGEQAVSSPPNTVAGIGKRELIGLLIGTLRPASTLFHTRPPRFRCTGGSYESRGTDANDLEDHQRRCYGCGCCCRPRGSAGVCAPGTGPLRARGWRALDPRNPQSRARHEERPGARPVVRRDAGARDQGAVARDDRARCRRARRGPRDAVPRGATALRRRARGAGGRHLSNGYRGSGGDPEGVAWRVKSVRSARRRGLVAAAGRRPRSSRACSPDRRGDARTRAGPRPLHAPRSGSPRPDRPGR